MTDETPRLRLPLLAPGQAQKEMTHNEALARLDVCTGATVVSAGATIPPMEPVAGQCWIVGAGAGGAWSGQGDALAGWTDGGWRFVAPRSGMLAWVEDAGCFARYADGEGWIVGAPLGTPLPVVIVPPGGATIDAEARIALAAIVARLQHFGLLA